MNYKKSIASGIIMAISFFSTLSLTYFAYGYVSGLGGKSVGGTLSSTDWNNLVANVDEVKVPTGAVMSFDLATCPNGWSEYTPARGRFIRGIDSTGTNDGVRVVGNLQADAFQGHWHDTYYRFAASNSSFTSINGSTSAAPDMYFSRSYDNPIYSGNSAAKYPSTDGTNGSPRTANETRPKNVALLFCQKN